MRKQGVAVDVSKVVLGQPRQKEALPVPGLSRKCVFNSIQHYSNSLAHWAPQHHHTPCGIAPSKIIDGKQSFDRPRSTQILLIISIMVNIRVLSQTNRETYLNHPLVQKKNITSTISHSVLLAPWHIEGHVWLSCKWSNEPKWLITVCDGWGYGEFSKQEATTWYFFIWRQLQSISVCSLPLLQLYEQLWRGICKLLKMCIKS